MNLSSHLIQRLLRLDPPVTRDLIVQQDLRVPMPDGVELLADRWAPRTGGESLPTALLRVPYGRRGLIGTGMARPLAERGFQVLMQSTRGTFGSGGDFDPMRCEREDGLSLETPFGWGVMTSGQERPGALLRRVVQGRKNHRALFTLPLSQADTAATRHRVDYCQDVLAHDADSARWAGIDHRHRVAQVSVPVSSIGGWYDIFLPGQLRDFTISPAPPWRCGRPRTVSSAATASGSRCPAEPFRATPATPAPVNRTPPPPPSGPPTRRFTTTPAHPSAIILPVRQ